MTSERDTKGQAREGEHPHDPVFYYKDSGIREKPGHIPLWLLAVVIALLIWGTYYLIAFWSPPPA